MTSLFLDHEHKLSFQKIAMPVKLTDSPESWQREIASEIYKQIPYLSDYAVNVVLDRVDAEKGFAYGAAEVTNKSEAPSQEAKELPSVRIPLLVRERMLMPMDIFMDGKGVFPLTPERLREHLFRTDTFETTTRKPSDRGIIDQLHPPSRSHEGGMGGGGEAMGIGMGKNANAAEMGRRAAIQRMKAEAAANPDHIGSEKGASLVSTIAHTIPETEADEFVNQVASDPALSLAAATNETFGKLAMVIARAERVSMQKTAQALVDRIRPTVVQFEKLASGDFNVKWANAGAYAPQEGLATPEEAANMAGTDLSGMQAGATVTVGTEKAKKTSLKEEGYVQVSDPGTYKVMDSSSNEEMVGTVMPVVDLDMHPLELFIFVNDHCYTLQDEIAGIRQSDAGEGMMPPQAQPFQQAQGDGTFIWDVAGKPQALPPMTIQNSAQTPDGSVELHGSTVFGDPVTLTVAPGLQAIEAVGEGHYAVPDFLSWLPLQNPTLVAKKPEEVEQLGQAQALPNQVQLSGHGGGEFSMEGPPVEKLAKRDRQFLKKAQAEFLLVTMGVNPFEVQGILKTAQERRQVKIAGVVPIVPLSYVHREMVKKAARTLANFPYDLRRNLVKEAAVLDDPDTADKVLAMNFINPENISAFAAYLPDLDTAAGKLAEMLMAARMGLNQVDEGAVERAMKNLEQVIAGVRLLQQKELV